MIQAGKAKDMILHIFKATLEREQVRQNPNSANLVATAKLENQSVALDVFDKKYEEKLIRLFSQEHYHFVASQDLPDGSHADIGEKVEPWDPKIAKEILPWKLSIMGLDFIIAKQ